MVEDLAGHWPSSITETTRIGPAQRGTRAARGRRGRAARARRARAARTRRDVRGRAGHGRRWRRRRARRTLAPSRESGGRSLRGRITPVLSRRTFFPALRSERHPAEQRRALGRALRRSVGVFRFEQKAQNGGRSSASAKRGARRSGSSGASSGSIPGLPCELLFQHQHLCGHQRLEPGLEVRRPQRGVQIRKADPLGYRRSSGAQGVRPAFTRPGLISQPLKRIIARQVGGCRLGIRPWGSR